MINPGDVVIVDYPGVQKSKRRPGVVVSSDLYHATRPDAVVALLTTQMAKATGSTDYALKDWVAANLHKPSTFRVYLEMFRAADLVPIGHLSDRDWQEARARLRLGLAVT
jgi:mRNA interferase MazF